MFHYHADGLAKTKKGSDAFWAAEEKLVYGVGNLFEAIRSWFSPPNDREVTEGYMVLREQMISGKFGEHISRNYSEIIEEYEGEVDVYIDADAPYMTSYDDWFFDFFLSMMLGKSANDWAQYMNTASFRFDVHSISQGHLAKTFLDSLHEYRQAYCADKQSES